MLSEMSLRECVVCKIVLAPNDMNAHLHGKKHKKKVEQIERIGGKVPGNLSDGRAVLGKMYGNEEKSDSTVSPNNIASPSVSSRTSKGKPLKRVKRKLATEPGEHKNLVPPASVDPKKSFDEQVNDFISQVRQTENEYINIQKVLNDIVATFHRVMPGVIPVLYGSQATGLAFRTSDIDVYLFNPRGEENRDFVRNYGRAIYRLRLFTNIILVVHARVPVIKAKHIETGIELDISATSSQAVVNSKLVYFLLSYDPRVRKLMMLVGYWAKKCNINEVNKFSRYSLNLLVIFYLQSLRYRILPPLCDLVYGNEIKFWPCQVYENHALLHNRNNMALQQLFIGFFEFYLKFNFTENVISTFLGKSILATEMEHPKVLHAMSYYKMYLESGGDKLPQRIVCVQDPLELSHNTTKQVTQKTLKVFELSCKKMVEMKEKLQPKKWMNEILNGEVAKPVLLASKVPTMNVNFDYPTGDNWTKDFKDDLTKTLSFFSIVTGSNLPNKAHMKKTKLDSDCLRFQIESTCLPFNTENKKLILLLKNKTVDYDYFLKKIDPEESKKGSPKCSFMAQCFVTSNAANKVNMLLTNEGDPAVFYRVTFNLRLMDCIIYHVRQSRCPDQTETEKNLESKESITSSTISTNTCASSSSDSRVDIVGDDAKTDTPPSIDSNADIIIVS